MVSGIAFFYLSVILAFLLGRSIGLWSSLFGMTAILLASVALLLRKFALKIKQRDEGVKKGSKNSSSITETFVDVKRKVFSQYVGQSMKVIMNSGKAEICECNVSTISLLNPEDVLILRPLIDITDDEAIEMAKMFGNIKRDALVLNRPTDLLNDDIHFAVQVYCKVPYASYETPKYWRDGYGVFAYQWLQSKGFDLPHYLLGEKTLYQSGLCEYRQG